MEFSRIERVRKASAPRGPFGLCCKPGMCWPGSKGACQVFFSRAGGIPNTTQYSIGEVLGYIWRIVLIQCLVSPSWGPYNRGRAKRRVSFLVGLKGAVRQLPCFKGKNSLDFLPTSHLSCAGSFVFKKICNVFLSSVLRRICQKASHCLNADVHCK